MYCLLLTTQVKLYVLPAKSIIVIDADGDGTGHEHAMFFTNHRGEFDKSNVSSIFYQRTVHIIGLMHFLLQQ